MRPTLSVADVAARAGWSPNRAWRAMVRWQRRGWPLVTTVPGVGRGGVQLRVDAAEFAAAILRGELSAAPIAA